MPLHDRRTASHGKSALLLDDEDVAYLIHLMYRVHLERDADSSALDSLPNQLRGGLPLRELGRILADSEEGRGLVSAAARVQPVGPAASETEAAAPHGSDFVVISPALLPNTKPDIAIADWERRLARARASSDQTRPEAPASFRPSGDIRVSILMHVQRADRSIERVVETLAAQTVFDRCELIVVDTVSSGDGDERMTRLKQRFPNIVYRRINYPLSPCDARNEAIGLARGIYLTIEDPDDLRKRDSLELQMKALDAGPDIDIVYQNIFYTLEPSLSFGTIAATGFVSDLPRVTPDTMLRYSLPLVAPMWRRRIHRDVGLFDRAFQAAGDREFWLRCLKAGKRFHLIEEPHVACLIESDPLSEQDRARLTEEGQWIYNRFRRELKSQSA